MDNSLIGAIQVAYSLTGITDIHPVSQGMATNNYFFRSEQYDFFLKCYQQEMTRDRLNEIMKIMHWYHNRGVTVCLPIRTTENESYIQVSNRLYAIFPKLTGNVLTTDLLSPSHIRTLAETQAMIHKLSIESPLTFKIKRKKRESVDISESKILQRQLEEYFQNEELSDDVDREFHQLFALKKKHIERLDTTEIDEMGDTILVHGDFHEENVLWRRGKIEGIVDWDFAKIDSRMFMVYRSIDRIIFNEGYTEKEYELSDLYLSVYNEIIPFMQRHLANAAWYDYIKRLYDFGIIYAFFVKGDRKMARVVDIWKKREEYLGEHIEEHAKRLVQNLD